MARGDQLGRQWKLIRMLIASKQGKAVQDLSDELECNSRTVYRDLEALQAAGFPIYNERVEGRNHWALLDAVRHQLPIPLSLPELMALYFSRDMLKVFKDTVFYDSIETLFQKIKATLPPRYINQLDRMKNSLGVSPMPHKPYGRFSGIIDQANEAAVDKKIIDIVYFAMGAQTETRRKVAPYKIWYFNGAFYLIGHCRLRNDIRIFALDRIKSLERTEESFEAPEDFDAEDFMRTSFGVFQGEPAHVKIRFAPEISGYISEKIWHASQELQPEEDGSLIFEADVAGVEEIKFWVMTWGAKAEVLEPETLRNDIRKEAEEMLTLYGGVESGKRESVESGKR